MQTVFMFSGQGSQYFQMGKPLYENHATFREWMLRLDEIARQSLRTSVVEAIYDDGRRKGDPFDDIRLTHPAIFMVEYALAQALISAGVRPDLVLGVSMGSFAAAAVAGYLDVEDALHAAIRQAASLRACEAGGMTAVLADPSLFGELGNRGALAAINFATHFVVSAKTTELEEIETMLKKRSVGIQRLPVSYAFHSQWIDRAEEPFSSFMSTITRRQGTLPLACCERTMLLDELPDDYFWDVVRRPIRFRETTARLEQEGPSRYIDVGPAGTLATFLKYGLPAASRSAVHAVLTPFGADEKNFAALS